MRFCNSKRNACSFFCNIKPFVISSVQSYAPHERQWPGLPGCLCTPRETIALGCPLLGRKWLKSAECGRKMRFCKKSKIFS